MKHRDTRTKIQPQVIEVLPHETTRHTDENSTAGDSQKPCLMKHRDTPTKIQPQVIEVLPHEISRHTDENLTIRLYSQTRSIIAKAKFRF
jgi:hypothetical protein